MTRASRTLTAGFIVIFGLAGFDRTAFAGQAEALTITLHVHNYARVPSAVLTRAEGEATRIYRALGVDLMWVALTAASAYSPPETLSKPNLTVILMSGVMAERKRAAGDVMGAAPGTLEQRGRLAYVFYTRVALLAHGAGNDAESKILGHVMAHEMGHLLLPANSHTAGGVMRADWDSEHLLRMVKGLLQFTPEQGELIRSHVSSALPQS